MLTLVYIVLAVCLIGTVIWAADHYLNIPAPFAWVKGILLFVLVVLACYLVWDTFVTGHLSVPRLR
jgi:hypothetical protein